MYNLATFDLNLLVAFDALMAERNVSRAAERVGLSQPAMSNALRRLRGVFQDELFVRTGRAMVPTGTALELAQAIVPALGEIRTGLRAGLGFDPASTRRSFILGFPDLITVGVLPHLARFLRRHAPGIDVEVIDAGPDGRSDLVLAGRIDLSVGLSLEPGPDLSHRTLGTFDYVVLVDAHNERLRDGRLTIADIAALPHVSFAPLADVTEIDRKLAAHGLKRRIAVSVPHGLSVPRAIAGSDLVAFMEANVASAAVDLGLVVLPDPLGLPRRRVDMIWHRRQDRDAGHAWLREQVVEQMGRNQSAWQNDR